MQNSSNHYCSKLLCNLLIGVMTFFYAMVGISLFFLTFLATPLPSPSMYSFPSLSPKGTKTYLGGRNAQWLHLEAYFDAGNQMTPIDIQKLAQVFTFFHSLLIPLLVPQDNDHLTPFHRFIWRQHIMNINQHLAFWTILGTDSKGSHSSHFEGMDLHQSGFMI